VGAACNVVEYLTLIVQRLRQAWPDVLLVVRGDNGLAGPEVYEYCEREGLLYAFGFATNAVIARRTAQAWADAELYYQLYGWRREPHFQRFEVLEDDPAQGWLRTRRVMVKREFTPQGSQRRAVVTNLSGHPAGIYRGFYVQRGAIPEQPSGELKNGLQADRLSASGFCANAFRLLIHVVAYALVVLYREACASVPEVGAATVGTLRERLGRVAAVVRVRPRQVAVVVSAAWPRAAAWVAIQTAVTAYVEAVRSARSVGPPAPVALLT
jgi:hypothetical protein